jgi:hypothetical protein
MSNKSEIAELRAELDKVKRQLTPSPMPSEADVAAYKAKVHADREARMSSFNPFTRDQLAAMRAATPDSEVQGIVHDQRGAPTGPASIIPSAARATSIRPRGTGWQHHVPLRNGIGQGK